MGVTARVSTMRKLCYLCLLASNSALHEAKEPTNQASADSKFQLADSVRNSGSRYVIRCTIFSVKPPGALIVNI